MTIVDAVVLAAGESSRLGGPKQIIRLHGVTLLERVTDMAREAVDGDVHVVLGAYAKQCEALLEKRTVRPHIFGDWAQGQNASLDFALGYVAPRRAVMVLLVDQYRLQSVDVIGLIKAWREAPQRPAAAAYADTLGVPVVWPAHYVQRLRAAPRGQTLLEPTACTRVPLAAAAFDLDTPEDLHTLREFERGVAG